jgi:hypothetical protein
MGFIEEESSASATVPLEEWISCESIEGFVQMLSVAGQFCNDDGLWYGGPGIASRSSANDMLESVLEEGIETVETCLFLLAIFEPFNDDLWRRC